MPPLLAVPNVSEGSDVERLDRLEQAFARGVKLLDRHSDADHGRTVFTLAGGAGALTEALTAGAEEALETIEMDRYRGAHPAIGALDVCPIVWFDPADREAAREEAVAVATQIAGLGIPVFLYGELARDPGRAERAYFRNGGLAELWLRMESGELRPDFGPDLPHRRAGATLVTARPPLAAFNVELDSGDVEVARAVAAGLRESGRRADRRPRHRPAASPAAAPRSRPTCTTRSRSLSARSSRGCASWRRRSAPGRWRPSWSAWSRGPRSPATRRTCRSAASTRSGT